MATPHEVTLRIKNSAMTVVDALEKWGAKVEGVKAEGPSAAGEGGVHRVTWSATADTQVRTELRRLEQIGEIELKKQD